MDAKLHGKTALVTGGTSGIGLAIALALAAEGVRVAIAARKPEPDALAQLNAHRPGGLFLAADVSSEQGVVAMMTQALAELGHLDFYVNNAAMAQHEAVTRISAEAWERTLNTNLAACVWACREAARHMAPRGRGSILIVGSTSMQTPGPCETVYRITKMGLRALSQSLAVELGPCGIRVNLLVPGHFPTRLTAGLGAEGERRLKREIPLGRLGECWQCGSAAVFLLSEALSGYTTGAELVVDGGLHLRPLTFLSPDEVRQLNTLT